MKLSWRRLEQKRRDASVKSIIVVDNFYDDPFAKREEALTCKYKDRGKYPGMNSTRRFYNDEAMKKIVAILGTPIQWDLFTSGGRYRISMATDTFSELDVHVDLGGTDVTGISLPQWKGICYLSLPQDCQGGTSFWRHNKTGLETYPTPGEQRRVSRITGIPNTPEAIGNYFTREGFDRSHWTEIKRVLMVFNRLLLFKSNLFHTGTSFQFGTTRENCRLIQAFNFNEADHLIKMLMPYHESP